MKTPCSNPQLHDKLLFYYEKQLNPAEMEQVGRHVKECGTCAADMKEMGAMYGVLQNRSDCFVGPHVPENCISADLLVRSVTDREGILASERKSIDKHVAACSSCRDEVLRLEALEHDLTQTERGRVPVRGGLEFLNRVSGYVQLHRSEPRRPSRSVAAVLRDVGESIKDALATLVPLQPMSAGIRSRREQVQENLQILRVEAGDVDMRIEIERIDDAYAEIIVFILPRRPAVSLEGYRAVLIWERDEIASVCIEKGRGFFNRVRHGAYHLALFCQDEEIATIECITSSGQAPNDRDRPDE
ncbi:MAG: hypothetical protein GY868_08315 [Deltaproteobacteria bacterium]|nr:hypothetical protein [Deltaproteobacteria bacterium]